MNSAQIEQEMKVWEERKQQATSFLTHLKELHKIAKAYEASLPVAAQPEQVAPPAARRSRRPRKSPKTSGTKVSAKEKTKRAINEAARPLSVAEIMEQANASGKKYSRQSYSLAVNKLVKEGFASELPASKGSSARVVFTPKTRADAAEGAPKANGSAGGLELANVNRVAGEAGRAAVARGERRRDK